MKVHRSDFIRPVIQLAFVLTLCSGTAMAPATAYGEVEEPAQLEAEPEADDGWWTPRYLIDYGIFVGGAAGYVIGEDISPRGEALIGPTYDPENPAAIFDNDEVSRAYVEEGTDELVTRRELQGTLVVVGAGIAAAEGAHWIAGNGSGHQLHDALVGFAETAAITAISTSAVKLASGRLRPDFGERARRYHCTNEPDAYGEECDGWRDRPLSDDPDEVDHLMNDGRRSFISAHSSHSFNTFTYASLYVGGRYIWGDDATTASRIGGVTAQAALMGAAGYISGSRLGDGRHHTSDIIAGSLIGAGIANLSYWRRFNTSGNLRSRGGDTQRDSGIETTLQPFGDGRGAMLTVMY